MESSQSTNTPRRLTESALARELSVSRQAVHELVKRGKLVKGADGLIDADAARMAILNGVHPSSKTAAALQASAPAAAFHAPPAAAPQPSEGDSTTDPQITSYHVAKTLREATEAQIARLKLAQMQGTLIDAAGSLAAVFTAFRSLRDTLLPVARRVAPRAAALTDTHEIQAIVEEELRQAFDTFERRTLADLSQRLAGPAATKPTGPAA